MKDVRPVVYHSIEEKRQAFMRAVNMRKEWEARMRKKIAEMDAAKLAKDDTPRLSQRLRGIAKAVPADFDYKKELESRF